MYLLLDDNNNIQKIVDSIEFENTQGYSVMDIPSIPNGYPETIMWDNNALQFVVKPPEPVKLDGLGILGLYTPDQHARAKRMLFATYPPGHEWEGQLVDPQALTQRLIDATLALKNPIPVTSEFHINGTIWMRNIGVIESDAERDRILSGIPPSSPMF